MKNIAIIGANGFLGSALSDKIYQKKLYNLICVYNKDSTNINYLYNKININDFLTSNLNVDIIYIVFGNFSESLTQLINLNCNILYNLTKKYSKAKFIYISSTNVYGKHDSLITEYSSYNLPNNYGMSKLLGEFIIKSLEHFVIIRFTYLYGKKLNNNSFLPMIINKAKTINNIVLNGDGLRTNDYLHINDAVDICIKAIDFNENDILLGATGISVSNLEISELIKKYIPKCKIIFEGEEKSSSYKFDPSLTFLKLTWRPRFNLHDSFNDML